ncbi:MAG: hypothetical protein ACYCWW_11785 [Deltaproteobacteria bacterium]
MTTFAKALGVLIGVGGMALGQAPSAAPPPKSLDAVESAAEDVGDAAAAADWAKVGRLVTEARQGLAALEGKMALAPLSRAKRALARLEEEVRQRRGLETQLAANRLSARVVDLYEGFATPVPSAVMWLDVLLRQLQLDGVARAPELAAQPLERATDLWKRLASKPPLAGSRAARGFDGQLAAVAKAVTARDAKALAARAGEALEGVDALERVFERAAKRR